VGNTSGIYSIVNLINGKIYVGSAVNINKRWKNHKIELRLDRHCNIYLQSAWNKYGEENFSFVVLEYCEREKLIEREQFWIDWNNCCNREIGYNLAPKAGSLLGFKPSAETLAKLSVARTGKKRSDAAKAAIKAGWEKRRAAGPVSEETKRKLSESHKGKIPSEETRIKMRAKTYTDEQKSKMSQKSKERWARKDGSIGNKKQQKAVDNLK
jgi:group I intron endonuclease